MKTKRMIPLCVGFLLLFCVVSALFFIQTPRLNWDMIGYVTSARAYKPVNSQVLQKEIYELLGRSVSKDSYTDLTNGHLRHIRATDPESLRQHLPFYQIRMIYVGLIRALWELGLNPFFASYCISAVCIALVIWILAFLPPGERHPIFLLAVPVIAILAGFHDLARYSTPDALSVLSVFLCYWLLLRRHLLLLIALPACILVRTDLLLLLPFFYMYLWRIKAFDRRIVALSAFMSIALYLGVNSFWGNYGWRTTFDYTFSNKSTHPADFPHTVTISSYLSVLKSGVNSFFNKIHFPLYIVTTFVGIVSLMKRSSRALLSSSPLLMDILFIFLSSLLYMFVHFMLFPVVWTRFFAGQYALSMAFTLYLYTAVIPQNAQQTSDGS